MWPFALASCQMKFSRLVRVITEPPPPESIAPITAWAGHSYKEIKVAGDGDTMHENEPRDADTRSCLVKVTLIPST